MASLRPTYGYGSNYAMDAGHIECFLPDVGGDIQRLTPFSNDGSLLVVSQFTLLGDTRKGRRPSWNAAASGDVAEPVVDQVVAALRARGVEVATGRFGAHMDIDILADGPVTIVLDV